MLEVMATDFQATNTKLWISDLKSINYQDFWEAAKKFWSEKSKFYRLQLEVFQSELKFSEVTAWPNGKKYGYFKILFAEKQNKRCNFIAWTARFFVIILYKTVNTILR